MVHAYWSYRVITYIIYKTIWKKHKNTIVKKKAIHNTHSTIFVFSLNRYSELLKRLIAALFHLKSLLYPSLSLPLSLPCFLSIAAPSLQSQPWPSIAASSLQ